MTTKMEPLLNTPEAAILLGVAEITLRKWRISGKGPRFVRCGASIRYRRTDLEDWILRNSVASTSEPRR
jgi:excisionase family DNA binding protein